MKVNTICELAKDGLKKWTILINLQVSGMNSAHDYFSQFASFGNEFRL